MTDTARVIRLHRIVASNPPTTNDFLSLAARGRPMPATISPEMEPLWHGVSMYDTLTAARYTARRRAYLGTFIAVLDLPTNHFRIEKTTPHPRHYTVWGAPDILLAYVVAVIAI